MGLLFCGGVWLYCFSNIRICFFGGNIAEKREIACRGRLGGGL